MHAMMFRNEARVGSYVETTEVDSLEYPLAMLNALGEYIVKWVCHKLFNDKELVLVKLELVD